MSGGGIFPGREWLNEDLTDKLKASIELVQLQKEARRMGYDVKDSGERHQFASGMQRDPSANKVQYDLVFDGPLMERLAVHLTKGAAKYKARNWMLACSEEEMERFRQSALRHVFQWLRGDEDEDHFAAVVFNMNGFEYVREKLRAGQANLQPEA